MAGFTECKIKELGHIGVGFWMPAPLRSNTASLPQYHWGSLQINIMIFNCTDIDDCAGQPCMNGGRCSDQVAGYRCQCAAGYTGQNCENRITTRKFIHFVGGNRRSDLFWFQRTTNVEPLLDFGHKVELLTLQSELRCSWPTEPFCTYHLSCSWIYLPYTHTNKDNW